MMATAGEIRMASSKIMAAAEHDATTAMHKLALEERMEYDTAPTIDRRGLSLGQYIQKIRPEAAISAVNKRGRLLYAGERARLFWDRIEAGMPLSTAVEMIKECERACGAKKETSLETFEGVVRERLARYDGDGHVRVRGGQAFRARSPKVRSERIAKGQAPLVNPVLKKGWKGEKPVWHKATVRDAVAAWFASKMPKNDPRTTMYASEFMREVEVMLSTFVTRLTQAAPDRAELFAACVLIGISRPKAGKPADQERAWKNRRILLRAAHPDVIGHGNDHESFQRIKDAYDVIVAYNDNLVTDVKLEEKEEV